MKRELELRQRLHSLRALAEVVSALKSLSAHHLRAARGAVTHAGAYREGVDRVAAWAGATLAPGEAAAGLVVVGAELGMCGSYNARMVAAGAKRRAEIGDGPTLCVGHRCATLLRRRGIAVRLARAGPTSVRGITDLLLRLAEDVSALYATERLASFHVVSSRFAGVGAVDPVSVRLLPFEPKQPVGARAARYAAPDHLASAASRDFLFITLYDLLLDALASEHGARVVATQTAERWLDERIRRLHRRLWASRREASTQEMIETAAGARARRR